jgi:hypothetical protein
MRITEDHKGHLLEAIWELNDRFQAEDDEALGQMFNAITHFAKQAAADERDRIVSWLRSSPTTDEWGNAYAAHAAQLIEKEYPKCT